MNPKPGMTTAKWIGGEVEQSRANLPSLVLWQNFAPLKQNIQCDTCAQNGFGKLISSSPSSTGVRQELSLV